MQFPDEPPWVARLFSARSNAVRVMRAPSGPGESKAALGIAVRTHHAIPSWHPPAVMRPPRKQDGPESCAKTPQLSRPSILFSDMLAVLTGRTVSTG